MVTGTRFDRWISLWHEFVLWLVKPFTRCGNDGLCIFLGAGFPERVKVDDEWLWQLVVYDGYGRTPIYLYHCPWCGRKLKPAAPGPDAGGEQA